MPSDGGLAQKLTAEWQISENHCRNNISVQISMHLKYWQSKKLSRNSNKSLHYFHKMYYVYWLENSVPQYSKIHPAISAIRHPYLLLNVLPLLLACSTISFVQTSTFLHKFIHIAIVRFKLFKVCYYKGKSKTPQYPLPLPRLASFNFP